jgi:hypothetical protein
MPILENDGKLKNQNRYFFVEPQGAIKALGDEASGQVKELAGSLGRIKQGYILLEKYLQNTKNILSEKNVAPKKEEADAFEAKNERRKTATKKYKHYEEQLKKYASDPASANTEDVKQWEEKKRVLEQEIFQLSEEIVQSNYKFKHEAVCHSLISCIGFISELSGHKVIHAYSYHVPLF